MSENKESKLIELDWFLYHTNDYQKALKVMNQASKLLGDDFTVSMVGYGRDSGWDIIVRHNKTVHDFIENPKKFLVEQ